MEFNHGTTKRGLFKKSSYHIAGTLLLPVFLFLFSIPVAGLAQNEKGEGKEPQDNFSYLIENGARMIRENEFERVLIMIGELSSEKKWNFRVKVLENSAYLKGYLVTKKKDYERKWGDYYETMCYSGDKTATIILIDLLKDSDPYMRAFTAVALGYLGDQSALVELGKIATQDQNSKVRSRAREAYNKISGKKLP
jgi:hypothetical protein